MPGKITVRAHPIKPPKIRDPSGKPVTGPPIAPPPPPTPPPDNTPASIVIAGTTSATVGAQVQFTATVKNAGSLVLSIQPDAWHSTNTAHATIDNTGLVTVVGAGTTSITATIASPAVTSNAIMFTGNAVPTPPVVTDNTPASITITGPTSALVGSQAQFTAVNKNVSAGVLTGSQPDAWHSSNTGVATISNTGLATVVAQGTVNLTASLTSPPLTSNTLSFSGFNPIPSSDGEPAFNPDTDTLLVSEGFDSYSTINDFHTQATALDGKVHLGSRGEGAFVAGRLGTGNALRLTYTNTVFQEIHKIETCLNGHAFNEDAQGSLSSLTNGKTVIVQDYRRVICAGGFGQFDDIAMKWMELVYGNPSTNDGDANLRQIFQPSNHGTFPTVWPNGAIWGCIGKNETFNSLGQTMDGKMALPDPNVYDVVQPSVWFPSTFMYRPNTSLAQKDGFARLWIQNTEVIRIRQDAVGVVPNGAVGDGLGGHRAWCIQADVDNIGLKGDETGYNSAVAAIVWYHQLISFTGNNFNGGPGGFTVDTDDIKVFTRP